jgi:hypothetical protein
MRSSVDRGEHQAQTVKTCRSTCTQMSFMGKIETARASREQAYSPKSPPLWFEVVGFAVVPIAGAGVIHFQVDHVGEGSIDLVDGRGRLRFLGRRLL